MNVLYRILVNKMGMIDDGYGNYWHKCDRMDCGLQVIRPGKAQCAHGEPCPDAEAWMRKNFPESCGDGNTR